MLSLQTAFVNEEEEDDELVPLKSLNRRRYSNFNFNEDHQRRWKALSENRRSSVATTSGVERRLLRRIKPLSKQCRVPTIADLNEINRNITTSVSTLAEYTKFYKPTPQVTDTRSKWSVTGLEKKRPDPCVVIATDNGYTERVKINISGKIFELYVYMLKRFPDGLLGDEKKRQKYWDDERKEFYFDHSGECFEGIMQYYQSGILRPPKYVHHKTFVEALEFFEFSPERIDCFKRKEAILVDEKRIQPTGKIKKRIWLLFDDPHSSKGAHILELFSIAVIILSLVCMCVETLPQYKGKDCIKRIQVIDGVSVTENRPSFDNEFFILETFCVLWFMVELTMRFFSSPSQLRFFLSIMNCIDLVSILPYFATLLYALTTLTCPGTSKGGWVLALRSLRVFRVFKLSRFSKGLKILLKTLENCKNELCLVVFVLIMGAFLFGMFLYTVEFHENNTKITSVFEGFWFGTVTITTVGYGDIVPNSFLGKLISTCCIIFGTVAIAVPAPIIVTSFNRYYRNETGRGFEDSDWLKRS